MIMMKRAEIRVTSTKLPMRPPMPLCFQTILIMIELGGYQRLSQSNAQNRILMCKQMFMTTKSHFHISK